MVLSNVVAANKPITKWWQQWDCSQSYRATPHCSTGYSPFYLLHGREMILPNEEDIKAKISHEVQDVDQVERLKNLKSSLLQA
jgi:hypothetical protein